MTKSAAGLNQRQIMLFATAPACRADDSLIASPQCGLALPVCLSMSDEFQKWSLIPTALVSPTLGFEKMIPAVLRKHLAFRMMVVLERI
jgi:hypothetical protein